MRRDRQKDAAGWISLPADGRDGDAPAWPLSTCSDRELELWSAHWRRPQAVMWEQLGLEQQVAMHVRLTIRVESPQSTAAEGTLWQRQLEELGLSPSGLARHRWKIGDQAKSDPVETTGVRRKGNARDRLKVINGGEA